MKQGELLDKYYKGETSLDEEKTLKRQFIDNENDSSETDMFGYFQKESYVPVDLEASVFSKLIEKKQKTRSRIIRLYSIGSVAAAIVVLLSIYVTVQAEKKARIENNFFVMEQALFQVSENIQPVEQEEMLVLWVDDDVEIIIN